MPAERAPTTTWICPTATERARFLDMHRRLEPLNVRLLAVVAVLLLPFWGTVDHPRALILAVAAMIAFSTVQRVAPRSARPELLVFAAVLGAAAAVCGVAALAQSFHDAALLLLGWPVAGLAGRFRTPVVVVGVAFIGAMVVATQLINEPGILSDQPLRLTLPVAAVICIAVVVVALRDSDIEHRGAANVDALTTLLNRRALMRHVHELEEQSRTLRRPIGVALVDLDLFKIINDIHGHAVGDRVLAHVGELLQRELRAYDLAFRLGGEEFVVLMPGATADVAFRQAEHLRETIAAQPVGDLQISASIGVSATAPDEAFDWAAHFAAADSAVYDSKRAGRNRVTAATNRGGDGDDR